MVNITAALLGRCPAVMKSRNDIGFWKKRQVLKMCQHFYGRSRNCYKLAIRTLEKSLHKTTIGRKIRQFYMKDVWNARIDAACKELGNMPLGSYTMLEAMARSDVMLNRQSLSNLAIWEPRTFECLNKIAAGKANQEKLERHLGPFPKGILGKL